MKCCFLYCFLPFFIKGIIGNIQATQVINHDIQIRYSPGNLSDLVNGEIVDKDIKGQTFFLKNSQVTPDRIGEERISTGAIPHPEPDKAGIFGEPVNQAGELIRTNG